MSSKVLSLVLFGAVFFYKAPLSKAVEEGSFFNYKDLSHKISLLKFRAGNHNSDAAIDSYYFKVKLTALIDKDSEHKLDLKKRKKLESAIGEFADLKVASLNQFEMTKDQKKKGIFLEVPGDEIRKIVSKMMSMHKIFEHEVGVKVDVSLFKQQKKFFVLNDDKEISSSSYFALPFKSSGFRTRVDRALKLKDKLGTYSQLQVSYNPLATKKK